MVKFKCLLSGNIFEYHTDFDIETMREHPQYEELDDGLQEEEQNSKEKVKKPRKTKEAK